MLYYDLEKIWEELNRIETALGNKNHNEAGKGLKSLNLHFERMVENYLLRPVDWRSQCPRCGREYVEKERGKTDEWK